jgi:hypothetical protein
MSRVGKSPDRFEPLEPSLLGRDPGVREPLWEGDMKVKRLREGVLGVDGGREVRVEERGGVCEGSIMIALADISSPNISFLIRARYMLSASSSKSVRTCEEEGYTTLSVEFSCTVLPPGF